MTTVKGGVVFILTGIGISAPALCPAQSTHNEPEAKSAPVTLAAMVPPAPKVESAKVEAACLEGLDAWFQRQTELTDGDTNPQAESISRCRRVITIAKSEPAK